MNDVLSYSANTHFSSSRAAAFRFSYILSTSCFEIPESTYMLSEV